jgi:hypothetical protein
MLFRRSTALASREPALFFRLVYLGGSRRLRPLILLWTAMSIDRLVVTFEVRYFVVV